MIHPMRTAIVTVALSTLALGGWAQTKSWSHLQISGETNQSCSVTITIGSEIFHLDHVTEGTTATHLCHDLVREINSLRHGHLFHAASNGVDDSILSIIADGSPSRDTTPWLGRLVPGPRIAVEPSRPGIEIRATNIQDTLVAVAVEGQEAQVAHAEISVKLNGRTFTLELSGDDPETVNTFRAEYVASELARLVNADPGFRTSVLRDDTGQLMIFIASENMGGGIQLQNGPTSVEGLQFNRSRVLFASQPLYTRPERH